MSAEVEGQCRRTILETHVDESTEEVGGRLCKLKRKAAEESESWRKEWLWDWVMEERGKTAYILAVQMTTARSEEWESESDGNLIDWLSDQ
jgi:hypothetical protein